MTNLSYSLRYIFITSGVLLLCSLVFLLMRQQNPTNNEIVMGVMSGYIPFAMINDASELEGFDIDVMKEIGTITGKTIRFKDMPLASLLIALEQGTIDGIISGLCITQDREKIFKMVYYFGEPEATFPLIFWKEIPDKISSLEQLIAKHPTMPIIVEPGSAQERFVIENCPDIFIKQMASISEIVLELKRGSSIAAMIDPNIEPLLRAQSPDIKTLSISLPDSYKTNGCGIAINKDKKELITLIANSIKLMQNDKTIEKFTKKWFPENIR